MTKKKIIRTRSLKKRQNNVALSRGSIRGYKKRGGGTNQTARRRHMRARMAKEEKKSKGKRQKRHEKRYKTTSWGELKREKVAKSGIALELAFWEGKL
jgi:hypothetical protein